MFLVLCSELTEYLSMKAEHMGWVGTERRILSFISELHRETLSKEKQTNKQKLKTSSGLGLPIRLGHWF